METYEHLLISSVVSPAVAYFVFGFSGIELAAFSVYGILLGVFIDLDHFVVHRIQEENWKYLKNALKNPFEVTTNNIKVVDNPIPNWSRYLSHFIILALLPAALYLFDQTVAEFSFIMLGSHITSDVYRSWRKDKLFFD